MPQHFKSYSILNKDVHSYKTRYANKVHINKVRTTTRIPTRRHNGPVYWNSLDKYITEAAPLSIFQARLRSYIFKSEFDVAISYTVKRNILFFVNQLIV